MRKKFLLLCQQTGSNAICIVADAHKIRFDTRAFLRYAVAAWHEGMDYSFAIRLKSSNRMIGSFGVINENGKLQFGYILTPTHWGSGYATEACRTMMHLLVQEKRVCIGLEPMWILRTRLLLKYWRNQDWWKKRA